MLHKLRIKFHRAARPRESSLHVVAFSLSLHPDAAREKCAWAVLYMLSGDNILVFRDAGFGFSRILKVMLVNL